MKKLLSLSFTAVLALSAAIVLGANLAAGRIADMRVNSAYKDGSLVSEQLSAEDFEMEGLAERKRDGVVKYVATDSDPQMYYTVDGLFTNMTFTMENTMPYTEIVVYYTTTADQGFSEKQRLWAQPVKGSENTFAFSLPMQYVHTLRIDPTVSGGSFLTFGSFQLNGENASRESGPGYSPLEFLGFTATDLPFFVLYTGLLASIIRFIQDLFTKKSD